MVFHKQTLPEGIMDNDEVCIQFVIYEGWNNMHFKTKRFAFAQMLPFPCDGYPNELCAALIVKRSEMIESGYLETERVFLNDI